MNINSSGFDYQIFRDSISSISVNMDEQHRLFRNKTGNTVLVIPTKTHKYVNSLYVFNFLLTGLGLTSLLFSFVMLGFRGKTFIPTWVFTILILFSIIVLILGFLGGYGGALSYEKIISGSWNWFLVLLVVIISLLMITEIIIGLWIIIEYIILENTNTNYVSFTNSMEIALKNSLLDNSELWWDLQKQFNCCGYDNNTIPDPLATGKFCTTNTLTRYHIILYKCTYTSIYFNITNISLYIYQ